MSDISTTRARSLRANMTEAEKKLWWRLRGGQLHGARFRRQAVIGRYIADFACFDPKIIIELDGGQHAVQAAYDTERTMWLEGRSFVVLRFWNSDVMSNLDGVLQAIEYVVLRLREGAPHPTPPPR
jgi:very-short-patch-repair endonuclease